MIPPHNSLVRYDNPILVSTGKSAKVNKEGKKETPGKASTTPTEDILNSILPPRYALNSPR
jgi:dynein light intermediate chain